MLFRYLCLLDRFSSDKDELDLSYESRTLKIRKIPKKELESFLLLRSTDSIARTVNDRFEMAIAFSSARATAS